MLNLCWQWKHYKVLRILLHFFLMNMLTARFFTAILLFIITRNSEVPVQSKSRVGFVSCKMLMFCSVFLWKQHEYCIKLLDLLLDLYAVSSFHNGRVNAETAYFLVQIVPQSRRRSLPIITLQFLLCGKQGRWTSLTRSLRIFTFEALPFSTLHFPFTVGLGWWLVVFLCCGRGWLVFQVVSTQ